MQLNWRNCALPIKYSKDKAIIFLNLLLKYNMNYPFVYFIILSLLRILAINVFVITFIVIINPSNYHIRAVDRMKLTWYSWHFLSIRPSDNCLEHNCFYSFNCFCFSKPCELWLLTLDECWQPVPNYWRAISISSLTVTTWFHCLSL